jgi:hypothetical protein
MDCCFWFHVCVVNSTGGELVGNGGSCPATSSSCFQHRASTRSALLNRPFKEKQALRLRTYLTVILKWGDLWVEYLAFKATCERFNLESTARRFFKLNTSKVQGRRFIPQFITKSMHLRCISETSNLSLNMFQTATSFPSPVPIHAFTGPEFQPPSPSPDPE